jgi:hypothetical protein
MNSPGHRSISEHSCSYYDILMRSATTALNDEICPRNRASPFRWMLVDLLRKFPSGVELTTGKLVAGDKLGKISGTQTFRSDAGNLTTLL